MRFSAIGSKIEEILLDATANLLGLSIAAADSFNGIKDSKQNPCKHCEQIIEELAQDIQAWDELYQRTRSQLIQTPKTAQVETEWVEISAGDFSEFVNIKATASTSIMHDGGEPCADCDYFADDIERLRMLGDRLVNAVHFLLDGAEPTEDLAGVLAAWDKGRND
jgi:hypothetical protein